MSVVPHQICLFFSPEFPGRVFQREHPQRDLRGGYWCIDPWRNGNSTVPRRVWLAGRRRFCDLRFDCESLSRVHFELIFMPSLGSDGVFGILSGGHHPNNDGVLEYHPSSLGVWVFDGKRWKKAIPGEPADRIDPEHNNRLWLGLPGACVVVGNSPEDTIGDYFWEDDLWPTLDEISKPLITPRLHNEVQRTIAENSNQWDLLRDWADYIQDPPDTCKEFAWKVLILALAIALCIVALHFLIN